VSGSHAPVVLRPLLTVRVEVVVQPFFVLLPLPTLQGRAILLIFGG
jgi:hypothetical protein